MPLAKSSTFNWNHAQASISQRKIAMKTSLYAFG